MNHWLKILLQGVIVAAVPVVLVVMPIRVLMHPRWVYFEYGRPDFPPDDFGFTPQERTRLAITGIDSIIGPRGVVVLQEAKFSDGSPAFNEREINHMLDVRVVTANIYLAQGVLFTAAVMAVVALVRGNAQAAACVAMLTGAIVTVVLLVALVVFVLTGFDTFFTTFHHVLFSGDTWLFDYTDTLIRLYPVQFWFDAATVIGVTSIVEAIVLSVIAWRWGEATR
jgi:integral membrane protein (TIGR01906 family)